MPGDFAVLYRPKKSLLVSGVITFILLSVPVFGVLYWYTATRGTWPTALAVHVVLLALCVATFWRQTQVYTGVRNDRLEGNGIFSATESVPLAEIVRVSLVPVYGRNSSDITTQFVALDIAGECRFRLRGTYWHETELEALARTVSTKVTVEQTPLSENEFFAEFPGSRYWFEGNPRIRVALGVGTAVVAVVVALLVTQFVGV